MPGQVTEAIVASINDSKAFESALFDLLLMHEYRHWRDHVETRDDAIGLPEESKVRASAKTAVDVVLSFFSGKPREELQAIRDQLIDRLVRWAGNRKAQVVAFN